MREIHYDLLAFGCIVAVACATLMIVGGFGNFPIMDDWAYAKAVQNLLAGELRIPNFSTMSLIGQVVWGALFSEIFGFSFATLKLSTFVLAVFGIVVFFLLLRDFGLGSVDALIGSLLLFFSPLYLLFGFTFMTEIPYVAVLLFSALCYVRAFMRDSDFWFAAACLSALVAILIRQNGVLIPVAAIIYMILTRARFTWHRVVLLAIPFVGFGVFQYWYMNIHGPSYRYVDQVRRILDPGLTLLRIPFNAFNALLTIGYVLIPEIPAFFKFLRPKRVILLLGVTLILITGFFLSLHFFPIPPFFHGFDVLTYLLMGGKGSDLPWILVIILGLLSAFSFGVIFISLIRVFAIQCNRFRFTPSTDVSLLLWLFAITQFTFILIAPGYFNKYVLAFLPFVCALLLISPIALSRAQRWLLLTALLIFAFVSVAGTINTLNYSNAKWTAFNEIMTGGISPSEIDGGMEFNGWYSYDAVLEKYKDSNPIDPGAPGKGFFVHDDRYKLSETPQPGYSVYREVQYPVTFGKGTFLILVRDEGAGVVSRG